ncbi:tetratricopeptide repeat protein [Confluentibacter sediminis]|uniref:tetratricopeptide repeat protein n=1 Tax=Confluentibacter sediminis TaxID=2219045 RepID=UPI000DAD2DCB|nr:tetratricopeptide repeat protein [Confluentibacter sediminis]
MKEKSNISQELLETIECYYNNSMDRDDRIIFEKKLQDSPEFKEQVEDIKTMLLGIETQALKEQLDDFHKEIPLEKNKIRFLQPLKIAVAAAIIIAFGCFWFFSGSSNQKLYAKYFTPDPGLPTTMSNSDDFEFYDAMVNYKHGDYDKAIQKWQVLYQKQATNDTINYFLGLAYMSHDKIEAAKPFLQKVTETKKPFPFLSEAYYYLGLAYLKEGQIELAKENLGLSNTEQSQKLLNELKN